MKITDNVYMLESTKGAYAYLVTGEETVLIDTCYPGRFKRIAAEMAELGVKPEEIKHILITHNDIDHIGSLKPLQEWTGAKVWISAGDLPALMGEEKRHGFKEAISKAMRVKLPEKIDVVSPGQKIGGVEAIDAPGHTKGHMCFAYGDVLFAGDLVDTRKGTLDPLPKGWNRDSDMNDDTRRRVLNMPYTWICPAHGRPVKREAP